jgi:Uma2 family endonuclease
MVLARRRYNGDGIMAATTTKRRVTADEYHRMVQTGLLREGDPVELIDGAVVVMHSIGPRHNACVAHANRALVRAAGDEAIVLPQGSVRLDLYYEPEPDLVLLRPRPDFYASRHAGPGDILLVVEVADTSLEYDREVKKPLYAAAGIPEYWLVDLNDNVVWRHRASERARYAAVDRFERGQTIAPQLLPSCAIAVDVLLTE